MGVKQSPIFLTAHFLVETKQQKKNFLAKNHPPDRTRRVAISKNAEYAIFHRMLADLVRFYAHMLSVGTRFLNEDFERNAALAKAQELEAQSECEVLTDEEWTRKLAEL